MAKRKHPEAVEADKSEEKRSAMERMDEALKAALKMPPRKHKDEKKKVRDKQK